MSIKNKKLTLEDRKRLEAILNSTKSTQCDKQKAQVLLLTDIGEHGPKLTPKDVVGKMGFSSRSIGRIREAYAENSSIDDVFRFAKLSNQSIQKTSENSIDSSNSKTLKKRNAKYVELNDDEREPFLIENVKCRVTLTKEEREHLESIIKEGKQTVRKFNLRIDSSILHFPTKVRIATLFIYFCRK